MTVVVFKKASSLFEAYKKNEAAINAALLEAITKSAESMGSDFAKVYYRSSRNLLIQENKKAA